MAEPKYPAKYKNKFSSLVVEFTAHKNGIVVDPGSSSRKVGYSSMDWIPCTDTLYWEPFMVSKRQQLHNMIGSLNGKV